ncbi:MAG TPA: M3 family metallopeptidase, partial [Usitatibacter sp.]
VPDEMIDKARVARDFTKGILKSRQHLFASYDLALYCEKPQQPMALWARMEGATPLGYVPGTMFPAAFEHITQDYAAGYYGYLWSEVIALDLRTPFAADRLDPAVGARYRQAVLSQGGQAPPKELVRNFLGRETDSNAFFTDLAR